MSIGPKSISTIIQEVNDNLDLSEGDFESKEMAIAIKALNELFENDLNKKFILIK